MRKMMLLVGAGLAAMASGDALAKAPSRAAAQEAEIRALREQVEALTRRLDAQQAAQAEATARINQAQSQAETAATQAAAASTQAEAAQTQIATVTQSVPGQVKTALAAQPKPKSSWADSTTVSGRMYFNVSSIDQKVDGMRPVGEPNGITNGIGFNIKRFYLGVDHTFDSVFSGNITTDVSNAVGRTGQGDFNAFSAPADAQLIGRGLYIKKAYLQAKLSPAFVVRLGAADMPWVPYDEGIYGYRHIENTLIDRVGFGVSADWGVHVLGDLADGLVSYQVSVVDGGGFRNVRVTKSVDVEGRVSLNYKGVQAGIGGYTGKLASNAQSTPDFNTASRIDALLAYKTKLFTLGGEYYWAKNYNNNGVNYVTTDISDRAEGYSGFGSIQFASEWSVFARYDHVRPRKDLLPALHETYYNAGLQYSPVKIVDLALTYKHDVVHGGTLATTNGTIGGATRGSYDEFGLFGQFRF